MTWSFSVDHRDSDDIRRNIDKALTFRPDPALREHVITNFTWPKVAAVLAGHYRNVVRHGGGVRS